MAATVCAVAVAGWYVTAHAEAFRPILAVPPVFIVALSLLLFLSWMIYGASLKLCTGLFRIRLAWIEAVGVYALSVFFNYLLFYVGLAFRGTYLNRRYGLPYPAFAAIVLFRAITVLLAAGLGCLMLILGSNVPLATSWPLVLLCLAALCAGVFLMQARLPSLRFGWLAPLTAFAEGWRDICHHPKQIVNIIVLELFGLGFYGLRLYVAFWALGYDVPFVACGLMALSGILSGFVSLTPGNLVIQEAAAAFVVTAFGVTFEAGLAAAVLDRAIDLTWAVAAGLVLTFVFTGGVHKPIVSFWQGWAIRSGSSKHG